MKTLAHKKFRIKASCTFKSKMQVEMFLKMFTKKMCHYKKSCSLQMSIRTVNFGIGINNPTVIMAILETSSTITPKKS